MADVTGPFGAGERSLVAESGVPNERRSQR
jgi:hypothetical protein